MYHSVFQAEAFMTLGMLVHLGEMVNEDLNTVIDFIIEYSQA